jgi:alkylation response protein AidB-like acyl-CoA dehydrogenase
MTASPFPVTVRHPGSDEDSQHRHESLTAALRLADELSDEFVVDSARRERDGATLLPLLRRIEESGLLAVTVPVEHGGLGAPPSTRVEIMRRLARADSSIGQSLLPHFVATEAISGLGRNAPAPEIYADVMAGGRLGNAAAERGTKSTLDLRTTIRQGSDGTWVIDGTKYYATGAQGATWIAVVAVVDEGTGQAGTETAIAFVRPDQPGVELDLGRWTAFGQRGTASGEVRLRHVVVENQYVLRQGPPPEVSAEGPTDLTGTYDQALHTAIDVGIARAALEDGATFVNTRSRPWQEAVMAGIEHANLEPHVVRRFGELTARLWAMEALLNRGTALLDDGIAHPSATVAAEATFTVAAAKALAQEFAVEIASGIFELTGTSGTDADANLDRHWRNVRTHSLHDPARWKYVHLGNHVLRGTQAPRLSLYY